MTLRYQWNCPCTNTDSNWPYNKPPYVGDHYLCDVGNPGPDNSVTTLYPVHVVLQLAPAASSILLHFLHYVHYIEIQICCDEVISNEGMKM